MEDFSALYEKKIDLSPLMDAVRVWIAPYSGEIMISAPVSLIEPAPEELGGYRTADGVRVALQRNGNELWYKVIPFTDHSSYEPEIANPLHVEKGDRLYFRVQSVLDGAFDKVEWNPEITYQGFPEDMRDVNDLNPYHYHAGEDFVYAGRGAEMVMPIKGTIRVGGNVNKLSVTSDDVSLVVYRNGEEVLRRNIAWDTVGELALDDEISVNQQDRLKLMLEVDSNIDIAQLRWTPFVYYTAADDPSIPLTDLEEKPTIRVQAVYDIDTYPVNNLSAPEELFVVPQAGKLTVVAHLELGSSPDSLAGRGKGVFYGQKEKPAPGQTGRCSPRGNNELRNNFSPGRNKG